MAWSRPALAWLSSMLSVVNNWIKSRRSLLLILTWTWRVTELRPGNCLYWGSGSAGVLKFSLFCIKSQGLCLHLNAEVTFVLFWRQTERLGSDDLNTRPLYSHTEREQLRACRVQDLTNTTKLLKNNISPRKLQQSKQNYPRCPPAACTEQPGKIVQDTRSLHFSELFRVLKKYSLI